MAESLFEQYKATLRRGHLAVIGGDLEAALAAYREAARIVPGRALPHVSQGTVLHRLGRIAESEAAFELALRLAPDDPAIRSAWEATRREPVPEAPTTPATVEAPGEAGPAPAAAPWPDEDADLGMPDGWLTETPRLDREPAAPASAAGEDGAPWPAIDLPSPPPAPIVGPPPDTEALAADAAGLIGAGDVAGARDVLLTAVAVHRAAGRPDAALDVCLQLLAIVPGDPQVHLAIAGLQLDRGWTDLAAEKINLLLRLTALTGDTQAAADAHALAAERIHDESGVSPITTP